MTSAADILRSAGITTKSTEPGRYYATCPQCSPKRKPAHQKLECLGITIDEKGVRWGCNHCNWKGSAFYEPRPGKRNGGSYSTVIAQYIYKQADGAPFLKVCKTENKTFLQFHWDGSAWIKGKPKGPKIPYRLPELLAANVGTTIYFCEGEKDADALHALGLLGTTCSEGAPNGWRDELARWFKDRHVVVPPDNDDAGRNLARKVATALFGIAASVKIVELPDLKEGQDVSDFLTRDRAGVKFIQLCKAAPLWEPSKDSGGGGGEGDTSDDELVAQLAALPRLEYAKRRKDAAKQLGITLSELDKIVTEARGDGKDEEPAPALYEHWNVEAASEPVDGGILLQALKEAIQRYVVMFEKQAMVVSLWIVLTWLHEKVAIHSPILLVTSPQHNSGKTTLLKIISFLVRRGISSVSITGPALFRSIEKWAPTFITDEADTAIVNNDDLKEVVNSGWTRGETVIRCDPETHEPRPYSTFCPKAIGMIGRKLPPSTLSRALIIAMQRKKPHERSDDFDHCDTEAFARLRSQLMRWAADSAEALSKAVPEIPSGFHNRTRANWQLLLAIAEKAGGDWKQAAWKAALEVEQLAAAADPGIEVQLLSDIRDVFDRLGTDRVTTKTLIAELASDEEGPWLAYGKGVKQITDRQLSRLLKDFRRGYGIKSKTIRVEGIAGTPKGYYRADFEDDFASYLSPVAGKIPFRSATPQQMNILNDLKPKTIRHKSPDVADQSERNPLEENKCRGVADESPVFAATEDIDVAKAAKNTPMAPSEPCAQSMHIGTDPEHYSIFGLEPDGTASEYCGRADPVVYMIGTLARLGERSCSLHERCAPAFFRDAPREDRSCRYCDGPPANTCADLKAAVLADEPGLPLRTVEQLAHSYKERGNDQRKGGIEVDQEELDAGLRQVLTEMVLPEFVEVEFQKVMRLVFAA